MDRRGQAAADVLAVQWHYASQGRSLAGAALAGARAFVEWTHHPREDHVDAASGVRFYYHAHAPEERAPGEHGHFHVFVRAAGEPGAIAHLVGISLDAKGLPLRLFTTNHWVTGGAWCDAATLARQLPRVQVRARGRLAPVASWLTGVVALYDDVIVELLHERDRRLGAEAAAREDRSLHIVSQRAVSLPDRLERLAALPAPTEEDCHVPCH